MIYYLAEFALYFTLYAYDRVDLLNYLLYFVLGARVLVILLLLFKWLSNQISDLKPDFMAVLYKSLLTMVHISTYLILYHAADKAGVPELDKNLLLLAGLSLYSVNVLAYMILSSIVKRGRESKQKDFEANINND